MYSLSPSNLLSRSEIFFIKSCICSLSPSPIILCLLLTMAIESQGMNMEDVATYQSGSPSVITPTISKRIYNKRDCCNPTFAEHTFLLVKRWVALQLGNVLMTLWCNAFIVFPVTWAAVQLFLSIFNEFWWLCKLICWFIYKKAYYMPIY